MFKVGEIVYCIEDVKWFIGSGPAKDEKLTVRKIDDEGYLGFTTHAGLYYHRYFRKLDYEFVEQVIENIKEEVYEMD